MRKWIMLAVLAFGPAVFAPETARAQETRSIQSGDLPAYPQRALACDEYLATDPEGSADWGSCGIASRGCRPLWTATANALFLDRRNPDDRVLAFNTANPAENLNASDLDFDMHAGVELTLARQLSRDHSIELRYFEIDDWDTSFAAATTPGDLLQINTAVPVFTFAGTSINANYASKLHDAEINSRQHINDWLIGLAGFRYVELDENARAHLVGAAPFAYDADTQNRLYGVQLGGQALLLNNDGPWTLDVTGKAGIFANRAAHYGSVTTGAGMLPAAGRTKRTSFVGEIDIAGKYQLTDQLALRGGYRLMWIDGVALASDQVAASNFATGRGLDDSGDTFYHGALAGLEYSW